MAIIKNKTSIIFFAILFSLNLFTFCGDKKTDESASETNTASVDKKQIKIGLIPEQNVLNQKKKYKPLGKYLEEKTGLGIKFIILSRYGNIIDNFNKLKLDGAFWGSFTGAMAIKKLRIEHIARPLNLDGTSSYRGYIFVHKTGGIKNVKDMKNKIIAFVDKATTAGYIFPVAYLKDHGVKNINSYFKESYFTGSHDAAIHAVLEKKADIGCAKNTIYDIFADRNDRVKKELVILKTSPDVPSNGLGLRYGLNPEIKKKLRDTLLTMDKDIKGKQILKKFKIIKFIKTSEKDYKPVFNLADRAEIDLKRYRYRNK